MTTTTTLIRIFVGSPGDVQEERTVAEQVIASLDRQLGAAHGFTLRFVGYEHDSWPGFGQDAQDVINGQIKPYDIFVGIMWARLGTPTARAASGTVEEFERAYSRWQEHGAPRLMFYFNHAEVSRDVDAEQLAKVQKFERMLQQRGGLLADYRTIDEFREKLREHLSRELLESAEGGFAYDAGASLGSYDAPRLAAVVQRPELLERFAALVGSSPIVLVEGLSGSGKTFLVADALRRAGTLDRTWWFDATDGSTLDDVIGPLIERLGLGGSSEVSRAKELLRHLDQTGQTLVVDDFHAVARETFEPLLTAASRRPGPARLILLSRTYVDVDPAEGRRPALTVDGLQCPEIVSMLAARGVTDPPDSWIEGLEREVSGLPVAVTLFATAVVEFGRDGDRLLADHEIRQNERLKRWFAEILDGLPEDARQMLRRLSVAAGPFNHALTRMTGRELDLPGWEDSFERLQRAHLVESYTPYRWRVHALIASFTQDELEPEELRQAHAALAQHYLRGWRVAGRTMDEETFTARVKAYRHLLDAGRRKQALKLLGELSGAAKSLGYYVTFINLCQPEVAANDIDPWLIYNYSHCCLITGRLTVALDALRHVRDAPLSDPMLRFSLLRLHAEVLDAAGYATEALAVLDEAMADGKGVVRDTAWTQALSIRARILLSMDQSQAVVEIAAQLLARAHKADDSLAAAVGLTYLGYAKLQEGQHADALSSFVSAVSIFEELDDRRGLAWATSGQALTLLRRNELREAIPAIRKAVTIKGDLAESSREYLRFLDAVRAQHPAGDRTNLIDEERTRVATGLAAERRTLEARGLVPRRRAGA